MNDKCSSNNTSLPTQRDHRIHDSKLSDGPSTFGAKCINVSEIAYMTLFIQQTTMNFLKKKNIKSEVIFSWQSERLAVSLSDHYVGFNQNDFKK